MIKCSSVLGLRQPFALAGICLACALSFQSAQAATVTFVPGTYDLAESDLGAAVDTLVVSISGGTASFSLSGSDNATFTVPDAAAPTGIIDDPNGYDPYYYIPGSAITASWDTTAYPYLTFFSTADEGGLGAAEDAAEFEALDFGVFQSTAGTGQVFTLSGSVPEPATWATMLLGMGLAGVAVRGRRRMNPVQV